MQKKYVLKKKLNWEFSQLWKFFYVIDMLEVSEEQNYSLKGCYIGGISALWLLPGHFFLTPDNKDEKKTTLKCNCYSLEPLQNSLLGNMGNSCSTRYRQ